MLRFDDLPFAHHRGILDGIAEEADISRPMIFLAQACCVRRKREEASAVPVLEIGKKRLDQARNILRPFPERGEFDGDGSDGIAKLLPEDIVSHKRRRVAVECCHDPDIAGDILLAPHPSDAPVVDSPEQFHLDDVGEGFKVVQEERSATRLLKGTGDNADAVPRQRFASEDLLIEGLRRERRTIHDDKRSRSPAAEIVDAVRGPLLAASRFSHDHHIDVLRSDTSDGCQHLLHRLAVGQGNAGSRQDQPPVSAGGSVMKIVLVTLALHLPPAHIAECDFFLSGRMRRLEIVGK